MNEQTLNKFQRYLTKFCKNIYEYVFVELKKSWRLKNF